MSTASILDGLPSNCPTRSFTTFDDFYAAVTDVLRELQSNNGHCNQHLVVVNLSKYARDPSGAANPWTRDIIIIHQLLQQNPPAMSPLTQQQVNVQQPYCIQVLTITPINVVGAPLVLRFDALDRPATGTDADVQEVCEEHHQLLMRPIRNELQSYPT